MLTVVHRDRGKYHQLLTTHYLDLQSLPLYTIQVESLYFMREPSMKILAAGK